MLGNLVVRNTWKCAVANCQLSFHTLTFFIHFSSQVEFLIPQLQFLDDEGAQAELWELSRLFLDTLIEETGCQVLCKAV